MKDRPIIFSGPMVRALLDGRKTQTRRIVNKVLGIGKVSEFGASDTNGYNWTFRDKRMLWNDLRHDDLLARCPYGQPGDLLWVREAWALHDKATDVGTVVYKASTSDSWTNATEQIPVERIGSYKASPYQHGFKPSIHMFRWASRLTLRITDVRVGRVRDISENDARAEGVAESESVEMRNGDPCYALPFQNLWGTIYGIDNPKSWESNPWVWVLIFEVIQKNVDDVLRAA